MGEILKPSVLPTAIDESSLLPVNSMAGIFEVPVASLTEGAEVSVEPSFEELFEILREARLARQALINRKISQTWASVDPEEKKRVGDILDTSESIRGHIRLPEKLPPLRVSRASELIEAGKEARNLIFKRLKDFIQPQLDEEFGEHAKDLKWEVENAISHVITSGRINNEEQIHSDLIVQFGISGRTRIREVKSIMTGEEVQRYEKNVQAHVSRLSGRLVEFGVDLDDAKQEARLAVLEAICNYKPELGKFPSYLFTIINGRLWDFIRNTSPMSRGQQGNLKKISQFESSFEIENGRPPTIEEVEQEVGIERHKILDLKEFPRVLTMADFREEVIERMENAGDLRLRDPDGMVEPEEFLITVEDVLADNERLNAAFEFISDRAKLIINRHDVQGKRHHEIGRELGLSEARTVQIRKKAIEQLRKMLTEGVSLKVFLRQLGISYASFSNNRFGEGLEYQRAGRSGAHLGPVEMLTIKKRVEARNQQVIANREARKEQTAKNKEAGKKKIRKEREGKRELKKNIKKRLNEKGSRSEKTKSRRPKEYKAVKPDDLEILLELYGNKLRDKEVKVLRLRAGLEDGTLRTLEETAKAVGLKTGPGALYVEQRGLDKLRKLEPSVFEQNASNQ